MAKFTRVEDFGQLDPDNFYPQNFNNLRRGSVVIYIANHYDGNGFPIFIDDLLISILEH